ncbi:hypothetical protein J6590_025391 [Homalodisca vitripennis]|nr:hypothetical protein J6590_025391 [Homalodisca vitripennis]
MTAFYLGTIEAQEGSSMSNNIRTIHRFVYRLIVVYSLATAIYDSRTKLSAALNLVVLEKNLESKNVNVSWNCLENFVRWGMMTMYVVHLLENLIFFMDDSNYPLLVKLISELTDAYFSAFKCSQFFGLLVFAAKYLRIHNLVNEDLERIKVVLALENNLLRGPLPDCRPQRRFAWGEDSNVRPQQIFYLKKAQNTLGNVEEDIRSIYWIYLVWAIFVSSIWTPMAVFNRFHSDLMYIVRYKIALSCYAGFVIVAVTIFKQIRLRKDSIKNQLSSLMFNTYQEESRKATKIQLLACNHRNSPFLCYFSNIDVALLGAILDNSLMIVCAIYTS